MAQIDSLSKENIGLKTENQEIKDKNRKLTERVESVSKTNEELNERMILAEKLNVTGISLRALKKNGKTEKVKIISERGRRLKVKNPFSRSRITCGTDGFFSENEDIEIETQVGMTVLIVEN